MTKPQPIDTTISTSPFQKLRRRIRRQRGNSAPARPRPTCKRYLIEDHFRTAPLPSQHPPTPMLLPGALQHDDDAARDAHDFFNLVVLVPLLTLNCMCWNFDLFAKQKALSIEKAWTGEYFDLFFYFTVAYFVIDLAWVVAIPKCIKSQSTIVQHHIGTMLYMLIPYYFPEYRWCMGACLSVEFNTWFLIARRVFNRQGFSPWIIDLSFVSIRIKLISLLFYTTWIGIRCILYPYLMTAFFDIWIRHSAKVGTRWNLVVLCVPLHAIFCLLNLKWTYDLLMSKIRYWRGTRDSLSVDKGLS